MVGMHGRGMLSGHWLFDFRLPQRIAESRLSSRNRSTSSAFEVFTRAVAMSNVRFVHFPARIVEAKLVTWEPADTHEIQAGIKALNEEDQDKLAKSLETGLGVAYG